ncbi:MAG: hypothetical protein ACRDGW_01225, partial [Actinomycetota bacterium]
MTTRRTTFAKRLATAVAIAVLLLLAVVPSGQAQLDEVPDWIGLPITLQMNVIALSNPASTQEELPGMGHKFELIGAMMDDVDPENMSNDTVSVVMTPTNFALAFRNLPPGIKIAALDNQLGLKYFFVAPRSCGGGSPRLTLLVDADGDGDFDQDGPTGVGPGDPPDSFDFAAHGHVNPPTTTGCPSGEWRYEDSTDDGLRWEITPCSVATTPVPTPILPATFTCPFPFNTWDSLEAAVDDTFMDHRVFAGFLVDDSCSFHPPACGTAHYDLV